MYWTPPSMAGLPQNMYDRWSDIWTPNGVTYGPVYTDPFIEDAVLCSRSLWLRLGSDIDGTVPYWAGSGNPSSYCPPGYSAWMIPRTTGQLVAIIRVLYDNDVVDYRYVYAKTDSTDDAILMAYSHFYGQTARGNINSMMWITPEEFIDLHDLGSAYAEDVIDEYYVNLYQWYIDQYW
jgi:hypothetical protein